MTSKELRDERGHRLYLHKSHDHMPDPVRQVLALDLREARVRHPQSAPARRAFLLDLLLNGAPWAEAFMNRCITVAEEESEREWKIGEAIARQELRDREAAEKGGQDVPQEPVVPAQRTEVPSVPLDDDIAVTSFSPRQQMTLVARHSQQRALDVREQKAEAAKRLGDEAERLKQMTRTQKGYEGSMALAQAISTAWDTDPDALDYHQVMRNAGLTYKQFGLSRAFFAEQLNEAIPEDKVMSAR